MEDIAREYIRRRNRNGMFVAVPHFDRDHYHVHICASGVEYKTGKSLRLSKIDLQKLKKEIQNYQIEKFSELSNSIVAYGMKEKSLLTEKEYQLKLRTGRVTNKEQIIAILKTCYKKANSRSTFFELRKDYSLKTYERNGKTTGIVFQDYKFRFSRLGLTEERFENLKRDKERENGLREKRSKVVVKSFER